MGLIVEPPWYHADLSVIRRIMEEEVGGFPYNKCGFSSRFSNRLLGLLEVGGQYAPKRHAPKNEGVHVWSYDPERKLYIDLTMDQFNPAHGSVVIVPSSDTSLLIEVPAMTESQRKERDSHFWGLTELLERYRGMFTSVIKRSA